MTPKEGLLRYATLLWALAIGMLATGVRIGLLQRFGVVTESDTLGYQEMARALSTFDMGSDVGIRTPGYPAFMVLAGQSEWGVAVAQIGLAVAACVALFDAIRLETGRARVGAIAAGLYAVWPVFARWDTTLLTESLATSLTLLCVWSCVRYRASRRLAWIGWAGLLGAITCLVRPNLLPVAFLVAIWAISIAIRKLGPRWQTLALTMVPVAVLVGGWCSLNAARFGWFGLSTVTGFGVTNLDGDLLARLPPGRDAVRDAYVASSAAFVESRRTRDQAIWAALPAMVRSTGHSIPTLSHELMRSHVLAAETYPAALAGSIATGYVRFWTEEPFGWLNESDHALVRFDAGSTPSGKSLTQNGFLRSGLRAAARISHAAFLAFLAVVPLALFERLSRRSRWALAAIVALAGTMFSSVGNPLVCAFFFAATPVGLVASYRNRANAVLGLLAAIAWSVSLLTASVEYAKGRFNVPLAPLTVAALAICLCPQANVKPSNENETVSAPPIE